MKRGKLIKEINYMIERENGEVKNVRVCETGNIVSISNDSGSMEIEKSFFEDFINVLSVFKNDNLAIKQSNKNLKRRNHGRNN